MLQFDYWKRVLILGLVALGLIFSIPNLFYSRVEAHNDALKEIAKTGVETPELVAARDAWPGWLPSAIMNLGLDLRGGAHLLAEVQLSDVYAARMDLLWPEVRDALRTDRATVGNVRRVPSPPDVLRVQISEAGGLTKAMEVIGTLSRPVSSLTGVGQSDLTVTSDGQEIIIALSDAERIATDTRTLAKALEIVRLRIDKVGTREPTIQRQGTDRILIQVPGIGSAAELKALIGTTAQLTFNAVIGRTQDAKASAGAGNVLLTSQDEPGVFYILEKTPVVSGEQLVDAQPSFDQNGRPAVSFRFDAAGARVFGQYTADNIGKPFAIVLDDKVISAPTIQSAIPGGSGIITGNFDIESTTNLSVQLSSGALPAKLTFLEERTIGPELGQDSIDAGKVAVAVAILAVVAFMIASYGLFGVFATVALVINMAFIFACLSLIGGTLTLPGIAGIVLTIGMAVDANVLVYERIREELRIAKGPVRAIELGYQHARSAIVDANVTTLITAFVLFIFGTGPVRGFAITLGVGIITSVFCAMYVTRLLIEVWFAWRRPKTIIV